MIRRRDYPHPDSPGVDAQGNPVRDPTANVLGLVDAAIQRQDDLRDVEARHAREIAELARSYESERANIRSAYDEELRKAAAELASVRAAYDQRLRDAEANRLDAIRAVDIAAVQRATDVATTQAATLAAQVTASAETLRASVEAAATASRAAMESAASAAATALTNAVQPLTKGIADLRQVGSEQAGGRAQVAETRNVRGEQRLNLGAVFGAISIILVIIFGVLGVVLARG